MPQHPGGGGGHHQYPDEDYERGVSDSEDDEESMMPHPHHRHQTSGWLDMTESSLKLTPADLDDQFLQTVMDLMNQFPEPPTSDAITDLSSPAAAAFGRRGLHMMKPNSHRRGAGGGGSEAIEEVSLSRHQRHQNPMYDNRRGGGVRELESPVRIRYSKPGDQFSF